MTITHIVIAKFKPEASKAILDNVLKDILALKEAIPEITFKCTAGKNNCGRDYSKESFTESGITNDRSGGYEWAWVMEFKSVQDLKAYSDHPEHVAFVQKYRPHMVDLIAVDYEDHGENAVATGPQ